MQRTNSGLLSSSYVPNDVERAQLEDRLKEDEGRLVAPKENMKIATVQLELDQLREEQVILEANIGSCSSALSTHRRLPVELWGIIFGHVCSEKWGGYRYSLIINHFLDKTLFTPPLILSQVCARWRNMVTSIPQLWSSIHLDLTAPFDVHLPIYTYLTNSKNCPLRISIALYFSAPSEQGAVAWSTLSSQLYRCIHLSVYSWCGLPAIQDLAFPMLEYVSLDHQFATHHDDDGYSWLSQALQRAPKLTKVFASTPCSAIPYPQLTSLEVRSLDPLVSGLEKLLHFLSTCQRLESLIIHDISVHGHGDLGTHTSDVKLPLLGKLALLEDSERDPNPAVHAFLASLTMPSLVDLRLRDYKWPDSRLLSIIAQRSPRIERLALNGCGAPEEILKPSKNDSSAPLISFLRRLSYLRALNLIITKHANYEDYPDDDPTTHAATALSILLSELHVSTSKPSDDLFLPRLEFIYLKFPDITLNSEAGRALAVAASRALVSPLKDFTLWRPRGEEEEASESFQPEIDLLVGMNELAMKGMHIIIGELR
ncbi:hypothetical protein V5O48_013106 [Marasmius crinis-equi]|uniref:F-box domain-containing protein n=1 Tax=Marasmius crinis-equi TaxID=585013 RepID=A0ABR3F108_9AGAR